MSNKTPGPQKECNALSTAKGVDRAWMGPLGVGRDRQCKNIHWLWEILRIRTIWKEQEDRMVEHKTLTEAEQRYTGSRQNSGRRLAQAPGEPKCLLRKLVFPLQIHLLRTCNPLQHKQIPYVYRWYVKAGSQKVAGKIHAQDAWRLIGENDRLLSKYLFTNRCMDDYHAENLHPPHPGTSPRVNIQRQQSEISK